MTSRRLLAPLARRAPGRLARSRRSRRPPVPADLINGLLAGLMGFKEVSPAELQADVADAGGVPFKAPVPLDFITPAELGAYLKEVLDDEYPHSRADADARLLIALDLLPPGTSLRDLRARLLEDNVAGFYDERPGRKKLFAVSEDRTMTPSNQIVLAHELRHALQDQYIDVHQRRPGFGRGLRRPPRRLHGAARRRCHDGDGALPHAEAGRSRLHRAARPRAAGFATPPLPGVPPVLRDHLIVPYLAGRDFVRALHERGRMAGGAQGMDRPSALDRAGAAPREVPRRAKSRARSPAGRRPRDRPPDPGRGAGGGADPHPAGRGQRRRGRRVGRRPLPGVGRGRAHARGVAHRVGHAPPKGASSTSRRSGASPAATAGRGGSMAPTSSAAAAGTSGSRRATERSPWWRATTPACSRPRSGRGAVKEPSRATRGLAAMIFAVCLALLVLGEGSVAAARHAQGLTGTTPPRRCAPSARAPARPAWAAAAPRPLATPRAAAS